MTASPHSNQRVDSSTRHASQRHRGVDEGSRSRGAGSRGIVVGLSGGIDSAVVLGLAGDGDARAASSA